MIAGSLEIELMANIARLQKDMDSVKGVVDSAMGAVARSVKSAQMALVGLGTGFATALTVASFKNIVMGVVETGAALDDLRMQTGATVEALSGLAAVGKFNNMSAEQIGGAMNMLAKNMAGATEESKGASKALEALGIDFDTFKKMRPEEQMHRVAKEMAEFEDGTGKSAVAMALYGKQGAQMLPFLHDLAEVSELQAKMTTEQASAAANFDDNLTRLTTSGDAWKKELAAGMLPALDQTATALLEVLNSSGGLRDEVKRLSKDGSVAEWTRNAVTGFSYVVDAGELVIRTLKGLGLALGGAMASTVTGVSSIAQAWEQVKGGDAFGAWDTLKSGASQVKTIIGDTYSDIADLAKQPTMGANFRAAMAKQVADAQNAGTETRKALDFTNIKDKKEKQEAETEYEKLVKRIKERIDAAKQEQEVGRALTDQEKFALKVVEDMDGAKKALTQTERARVVAMLKTSAAENEAIEQQRARIQFDKDLRASENQRIAAYEKTVQASADANKQLRDEIELIGLTEAQQLAVTQARSAGTIAQKEQTLAGLQHASFMSREAIALEEEIRLLKERSDLLGQQAARTTAAKQVEVYNNEWVKFYDSLYQGLTDSLYRSFEAGKGFFSSFWAGIKNTLKTSVLKFAIQGVLGLTGVTGALGAGGVANAAAGGANALGMANNASSAYSAYGIANTAYNGGVPGLVSTYAGSGSYLGYATGLTSIAPSAVGAANAAGAVAGGDAIGYLAATQGWTGAGGSAAMAAGTNAAAAGSASTLGSIGSTLLTAAPYLAAAALVGNALGLFRSKKVTDTGLSGSIGYGNSDINTYTETRKGGTLFSGPKYSTSTQDLDATQAKGIQTATDAIYSSAITYGKALGLSTDAAQGYTKALDLSTKDLTDAQIQEKLNGIFVDLGNELANQLVGGISENFGKSGETASATLGRLAVSLQTANGMLDSLDRALLATSLGGAAAASGLIDAFGGVEAMQERSAAFLQNYYTEAERSAITTRQLTTALQGLGIDALPASRDAFRALVEQQDLYTDAGRATYAALLGLSDAFASVTPEIGAATEAVESLVLSAKDLAKARESLETELLQAQGNTGALRARELAGLDAQDPTGSLRALKEAIYGVADAAAAAKEAQDALAAAQAAATAAETARKTAVSTAYDALGRSVEAQRGYLNRVYQTQFDSLSASVTSLTSLSGKLKSTLDGMSLAGTEAAQRAAAQAQIQSDLRLARAGGAGEIDQDRLGLALATAAKDASSQFSTYEDYATDYAKTANSIAELSGITDAAKSIEERQLATLQANHAAELQRLDNILASGKDLVDRANGIDTRIQSLTDALLGINKAGTAAGVGTVSESAALTFAGGYTMTGAQFDATRQMLQQSKSISDAMLTYLGRTPDIAGLVYWEQMAQAGSSIQSIVDAIKTSPEAIQHLDWVPAFAAGGSYQGGLALVGEEGPELINFKNPGQVYTAPQTMQLAGGGNDRVVGVLERVIARIDNMEGNMRAGLEAVAEYTNKTARRTDELVRIQVDTTGWGDM